MRNGSGYHALEGVVREVKCMNKGLVSIGLIGGIITLVGMFIPWATASGSVTFMGQSASVSAEASGWNISRGEIHVSMEAAGMSSSETVDAEPGPQVYPYLALIGSVVTIVGAAMAFGHKTAGYLLVAGGILAIIGAAWGFVDIDTGAITLGVEGMNISATASYGYGLYLCLVGAILALVGSAGLRGK